MSRPTYHLTRYLILTPILGGIGMAMLWSLGFLSFLITVSALSPHLPDQKNDGLVVFTGGADRVQTGLDLLKAHQGRELLISGVRKGTTLPTLIEQAKRDVVDFPCCITLGFSAIDTVSNAQETATWAQRHQVQSVLLITSHYHMPRALIEMRRAAPDLHFIPYPVVTTRSEIFSAKGARLLVSEYHKTILALGRLMVAEIKRL